MDLASAGLKQQAFRTHGKPLCTVSYASHAAGLQVLEDASTAAIGISLLQGPSLSGKTTLIREFISRVPEDCSVAVIDGAGLNTTTLLETLLRQFGYSVDFNSTTELFAMLRVFATQQASSHRAPVIIVENAHALNPSSALIIRELAALKARQSTASAIKMVLASDRSLRPFIECPDYGFADLRVNADFHLRPMSMEDASRYLHGKLRAAGSEKPQYIFPLSVCDELWRASAGWPGILDRVALLALAKAEQLPISMACITRPALPVGTWSARATDELSRNPPEPPMLLLSGNGQLLQQVSLEKSRFLIGRSEHNDLCIDSRFISRHHLLLVQNGASTLMMDLNSSNGTSVNSRRVSNQVLMHDDIITIGQHRIKFRDPYAMYRRNVETPDFADTAIMKTLEDMRALLSGENTETFPAPSENLPTLGEFKNQA
ncbi:MAG TPA: FHA domain-containing protein [Woeseiaceae bacterium]|nr:FHA domain-containing protein [Woeseiaceae bacterium]